MKDVKIWHCGLSLSKEKPINLKSYKINEEITNGEVRLLDEKNKQVGVVSLAEAKKYAGDREFDLVLIAEDAIPPVVKAVDFEKFRYQLERKAREAKRNIRETQLKEVRLTPFISEHDMTTILERAREFLKRGDLVKVTIRFTGRQMAHQEFGPLLAQKVVAFLGDDAQVEREAKFEGRRMIFTLAPKKKIKAKEETKDA